jgi:hypothetical protein
MQPLVKPRNIRIVTGPCAVVEAELASIGDEYGIQSLSISVVGLEVHATAVLIHASMVRKMQIANPGGFGGRPN